MAFWSGLFIGLPIGISMGVGAMWIYIIASESPELDTTKPNNCECGG